MGYIIVLVLAAVVVVGLIVAFMTGKRRPAGRTGPGEDVTPKMPGAESPTPQASSTANPRSAETAQRHTPPA